MAETSRDSSHAEERELAETVGASPTGPAGARAITGLAPSGAVRALLEMSPTMASTPGVIASPEVHVEIGRAGDLEPGTLLDESYRVLDVLGRGGMGTVYLVEHTRLGRRFAAKVIADALANDAVLVARLHAEARVASRIRHENIVDVTHLGQTKQGALFVVMELLEGHDLRSRLDEPDATHGLPFEDARAIAEDLFAGLAAAHAQGVVHRDLKPENVFLAKAERGTRAKIVDFGIAKAGIAEGDMRLTQTGQVIGTPLYMSPEQSRDTASVGASSDQYSLGVVLYEMLTGRRPFEARNPYELVVKHATESPRPLRQLRAELPAAVEQVVLRCLEKSASARFTDVTALRDAWRAGWETTSASEPPATPAPSKPPSLLPPDPGTRGILAAFLGAIALAGAGGVWMVVGGPLEDAPPASLATSPTIVLGSEPDAAVTPPDAYALPVAREAPLATRRLETRPTGASVSVDGSPVCTTPCEVTLPASGSVEVTIQLRGHRRVQRTLSVGDPESITIPLSPAPAADRPPALAPR
ncbi:MAG: serine/threonine protein kinase [Deltaproteobacteria bacterium]|nr:serine/threonine protein kinase [Deltaproteobacteria bacterium]